jgi:hypothetical protein
MELDDQLGYVTLSEANSYITDTYVSTDELRIAWEGLSGEDKAALLRKSFQTIELLPFFGRKFSPSQPNAFPRWPYKEVPKAIKYAQVEQAIFSCDETANEEAKQYEKMWQWGVSSYTIGKLSESLSTGDYGKSTTQTTGITSAAAARYLAPFMHGGYQIR